MRLLEAISNLFAFVNFHVRFIFLRVSLFFLQNVIHSTGPAKRGKTALLIGDATALGLGDSASNLGLSTRLPALLRDVNQSVRPRFHWSVLTAGKLYSRAADWVPGAEAGFFEDALGAGPFRTAEVVIIILGAHDDVAEEGSAVVQHVARVAEGVVRLGKQAVVVSLPNGYSVESKEFALVREANAELTKLLAVVKRDYADMGGGIAWDVDIGKVFALGNEMLRFEEGFISLNANGFRLLARELYEPFALAAKRVEWTDIKDRL